MTLHVASVVKYRAFLRPFWAFSFWVTGLYICYCFPFFFWENNIMEIIHFRKLFSWHSPNFLSERKRKCEFLVILLVSGGLPFINLVEKAHCFHSLKGNISKAFSPAIIIVLFIVIQSLFWVIIFKRDNILILRCYPITSMQISVIVKKSFIVWILFFNLIIQIHLTLYFFFYI